MRLILIVLLQLGLATSLACTPDEPKDNTSGGGGSEDGDGDDGGTTSDDGTTSTGGDSAGTGDGGQYVDPEDYSLTIDELDPVNLASQGSHPFTGTCIGNDAVIEVLFNSGGVQAKAEATCTAGIWSTTLDVSNFIDGTVPFMARFVENPRAGATGEIQKDTTPPSLSVVSLDTLTAANIANYTATGTCSATGQPVTITISDSDGADTGLGGSVNCLGGAWSLAIDFSGEADGSFQFAVSHQDQFGNAASPSPVTLLKDTVQPVVTLDAFGPVNAGNMAALTISGNCSVNGLAVEIEISDTYPDLLDLSASPVCTGGTFSTTFNVSRFDDDTLTATATQTTAIAANVGTDTETGTKDTGGGPTFSDQTTAAGLNGLRGDAYGVAWGDYDNDGYDDLYLNSRGIYRNQGDGTFVNVPGVTGVIRSGHWGDYDNDGFLDLVLASSAALTIYLNDGDGTFTVQDNAMIGVADVNNVGDIAFLDSNGDGWLDIFAANGVAGGNRIYENDGAGASGRSFTTRDEMATGLVGSGNGETVLAGDYDGDGDTDLYYTFQTGMLYRSNGDGTYNEVAAAAEITRTGDVFVGNLFGDIDNDGDMDLFLGSDLANQNKLYLNDGDGTFTDVTAAAGVGAARPSNHRGASFGDYDHDGDLDLFLSDARGIGNCLYRNNGDGTFTNVAPLKGLSQPGQATGGAVFADYDNDGDLDIYVEGGAGGNSRLWRNDLNDGNYLRVKVTGAGAGGAPVDGTGARIELWDSTRTTLHAVREISGGEGMGSHKSRIQHFGLPAGWGGGTGTYDVVVNFTGGGTSVADDVVPSSSSIMIGGTTLSQTINVAE